MLTIAIVQLPFNISLNNTLIRYVMVSTVCVLPGCRLAIVAGVVLRRTSLDELVNAASFWCDFYVLKFGNGSGAIAWRPIFREPRV